MSSPPPLRVAVSPRSSDFLVATAVFYYTSSASFVHANPVGSVSSFVVTTDHFREFLGVAFYASSMRLLDTDSESTFSASQDAL